MYSFTSTERCTAYNKDFLKFQTYCTKNNPYILTLRLTDINLCHIPDLTVSSSITIDRQLSSANSANLIFFNFRKEFQKIAIATAIGFALMGFIGFFVKLIHIPINNIIVGS